MQRGCFLLVAAAVFAAAEVRSADPIGVDDFSGFETIIDFSGLTVNDPITDQFAGANFNGELFATLSETARNTPNFLTYNGTITVDMDSTVNRVGFDVVSLGGTVTSIVVNGVTFPAPPGDFVGIEDPAGFNQVVIVVNDTVAPLLFLDNFRFEATDPAIAVTDVNFGDVEVGTTALDVITVSNGGEANLSVTAISDPGGEFAVTLPTFPLVIAPGGSEDVQVSYSPVDVGADMGSVDFTSNDPGGVATSMLSGNGIGTPMISVPDVDFGNVDIGMTGFADLMISNNGGADLTVTAVSDPGSPFGVDTSDLPLVIPGGMSDTVPVTFTPTAEGVAMATVDITSDDPDNMTVSVDLMGTGVGVPDIVVDPGSVDFGDVFVGGSADDVVTVRNEGTGTLFFVVTLNGLPPENAPGPFAMLNFRTGIPVASPIPVVPGGEVTFDLRYSPTSTGVDMGTIELDHNDPDTTDPLIVDLEGEGIPELTRLLEVTPSGPVQYGGRIVGTTGSQTLTLTNIGSGNVIISSVELSRASHPSFFLSGEPTSAVTLRPQDPPLRVRANYSPTNAQAHAGAVVISHNATNLTDDVTVQLRGTGIVEEKPEIEVTPTSLALESFVGTAETEMVTVTNVGTLDLTVSNVALGDGSSPDFTIGGETSFVLVPGASNTVDVTFTPSAVGEVTGTLVIESDDEDESSVEVVLTGNGLAAPEPRIAVDTDPSLGFGEVLIGSSLSLTVTIRNSGIAILNVLSIGLSDDTSDEYAQTAGPDSVSLVPGAEVAIEITYTPLDGGFDPGELIIVSEDPNQPEIVVVITGFGVSVPTARVDVRTAPALAYGQVMLGSSPVQIVTVANVGSANLEVTNLALSEETSAQYSISNGPQLPANVAPGAHVDVEVTFAPDTPGFASGSLSIETSDAASPLIQVSLTAVGVETPVAAIVVDPEDLDFGEVDVDGVATLAVTVRNLGSANLELTAIFLGEGSSDAFSLGDLLLPISVAPEAQVDVEVTFSPAAPDAHSGTLVIESNDPDDAAVSVSLAGSGLAPPAPGIGADTDTLDFADVEIGTSSVLELTVSNTGTADLTLTSIGLGDGTSAAFTLGDIASVSPSILMLGDSEGPTFGADPTVFAMLSDAYGEAAVLGDPGVFYMQGEISTSNDATLVDLVLISSSLNSGTVRDKFEDTTTAVLNYESALMDSNAAGDFFLSEGGTTSDDHTQINILAPGHPLAAGLNGTVDVFTEPQTFSVGTGALGPGVIRIAEATSDTSLHGIFAAEAGAELLGDGSDGMPATAAGRRVMFFLQDVGADFLTDDGEALFFAAVEWLAQPAVAVLAPGESIVVSVTYSPAEEVTDTGTVQVESDAGDLSVALMGNGVPGAVMQIRIAPPSVDFGGTLIGTTANADITIRNLGSANLDLSGVAIGVGSSLNFNVTAEPEDVTIEPGGASTVNVSYTPSAAASDSGTVRIASNDPRRPSVPVSLFGFGSGESIEPVFKRGDANADATVDISDVVKTLMFLFGGGSEPVCYDAADSNDDGTLDISDGLFTVRRLFGGSDTEPPLPVSDTCAVDASGDSLPRCDYPLDACGL